VLPLLGNAVGVGECAVVLYIRDLEPPEPEKQQKHDAEDGVLDDSQLDGREIFLAVEQGERVRHDVFSISLMILNEGLFVSQRDHWVHAHRSSRWEVAG